MGQAVFFTPADQLADMSGEDERWPGVALPAFVGSCRLRLQRRLLAADAARGDQEPSRHERALVSEQRA
jgi:hypothetical protein